MKESLIETTYTENGVPVTKYKTVGKPLSLKKGGEYISLSGFNEPKISWRELNKMGTKKKKRVG